jgi:hypothetical protein
MDISQSMPRSRRQSVAVEPLAVSPKIAGEMLDFGKTKIAELIATQELESYVDGGARRVLVASINRYVTRKLAASAEPARRGPSRPRKDATT